MHRSVPNLRRGASVYEGGCVNFHDRKNDKNTLPSKESVCPTNTALSSPAPATRPAAPERVYRDRPQVDMALERVRARLSRETEPRVTRACAFPAAIRTSHFTWQPTHPCRRGIRRARTRRATRPRRGAPRVHARRRVLPRGRACPAADFPARLTSPLPRARSPRVACARAWDATNNVMRLFFFFVSLRPRKRRTETFLRERKRNR